MKPNLRHIEAALDRLDESPTPPAAPLFRSPARSSGSNPAKTPSFSFKVWSSPQTQTTDTAETVQPFATAKDLKLPSLPRTKFALGTHRPYRSSPQPTVALEVLQQIETQLTQWQTELQSVVRSIQAVYMEGPIVDGWLETDEPEGANSDATQLIRHGDLEMLMEYVQNLSDLHSKAPNSPTHSPEPVTYRFCRLDSEGRLVSQPCPADQLPSLSLAIARHQKLRLLLNRKEYLEARLGRAASSLETLQTQIASAEA